MVVGMRPRLVAAVLVLCLGGPCVSAESRTYHSLWGSLFKKQPATAPGPSSTLHSALSELQSRLLARLAGGSGSSEAGDDAPAEGHRSALEELLAEQLNTTLSALGHLHSSSSGGGSSGDSLLYRMHDALLPSFPPGGTNWTAADARELAVLAWTLGALAVSGSAAAGGLALHALGSSSSGGGGAGSVAGTAGGLSSSLGLREAQPEGPVAAPSWDAFKPHTCLRLQNWGSSEGFNAALIGPAPCCAATPGTAAASSDALRWGTSAAFMLDCSRRGGRGSFSGGSSSGEAGSAAGAAAGAAPGAGGMASGSMLQEASKTAAKVAADVAAAVSSAWDTRRTCRLAISSTGAGSGSAAHLDYSFDRPLFGPKLDALRVRICNLPPSSLQYPAALAHGTGITLAGLKLNGRPLLPGPATALQAAASEGCQQQLYRLGSKATKQGFMLSGWVELVEGSSGPATLGNDGGGASGAFFSPGSAGGLWGVGEMASVELTLGEYSFLDAAASRFLSGGATAAAAAATVPDGVQQQQQGPPSGALY